jgi:N-acetyl sugar amidotransferase
MIHCTKCLLPQTHETISYDELGVCSICRQIDVKKTQINWAERKAMLTELIVNYKDKGIYDCIVPFSGGKDSVFQLYYIVRKLNLKPLVVRFDHWGFRPLVHDNNENVFKKLGVDVITFTPNWKLVKALMLEALKRTGDFCWHCHTGIFAHTAQLAIRYQTPLVFWGESPAEYTSHLSLEEIQSLSRDYFNTQISLGINTDQMYEYLGGKFSKRDLSVFEYPGQSELDIIGYMPVYLGNYIKWDTRAHVDIIKKELNWKGQDVEGIPPEYDYEKIECKWQGIRDYCRFIKRGYGRTSHLVAIDIRHDRLSTEDGRKLVEEYDGKRPGTLDRFLELL